MIEYKLNEEGVLVEVEDILNVEEFSVENNQMPVRQGFWSSFKNFLFQEINLKDFLFQEVNFSLELTSYEKKVFSQVKDFWTQDVSDLFRFK